MKGVIDLHTHLATLPTWIQSLVKFRNQSHALHNYLGWEYPVILNVAFYAPPYTSFNFLIDMIDQLQQQIQLHENIQVITKASDLERKFDLGLLFHVESGRFITEPKVQIPVLHEKGVRGLIPLHYIDNQFGESCDDPLRRFGLKTKQQGLTDLAQQLIEVCHQHHWWLDVTHSTDLCSEQWLASAEYVMCSHVGIRDRVNRARNKSLQFFKQLQAKKGVWGLSPWLYTVGDDDNAYLEQIQLAIDQGLCESVCIGTDFGTPIKTNQNSRDLKNIASQIQHKLANPEQILWNNAYSFFKRALPQI